MDLYLHHGRLDPSTGGTTVGGSEIGDWGFDGPRLTGVVGFHCTYGLNGHFNVYFDTIAAAEEAQRLTCWKTFDDDALTIEMTDDCVRIYNAERQRYEYFGDWGMM